MSNIDKAWDDVRLAQAHIENATRSGQIGLSSQACHSLSEAARLLTSSTRTIGEVHGVDVAPLPENSATKANIQGWANRYLDEHLNAAIEATVEVLLPELVTKAVQKTTSEELRDLPQSIDNWLENSETLYAIIRSEIEDDEGFTSAVTQCVTSNTHIKDFIEEAAAEAAHEAVSDAVKGLEVDSPLGQFIDTMVTDRLEYVDLQEVMANTSEEGRKKTLAENLSVKHMCEGGLVEALVKAARATDEESARAVLGALIEKVWR